ncbi:MAG: four helix bundle protein [Deltaproteobacteria bacterium]|nr:four helix bundle protein [Deltaproteobacteria bacterium]MBW2165118.1 four helix bundle protein [Deltaproteobacteria bacterium]
MEYHLLLSCDLNHIQDETYRELNQQVNEVKRMLNSFIQKLTAQVEKLYSLFSNKQLLNH